MKELLKKCEVRAWEKAEDIIERQRLDMIEHMEKEIERLDALCKVNPAITEEEVTLMKALKKAMFDSSKEARIRLEAVRLIL